MRIRELARASGLSTKTIRYYESIGVLSAPRRAPNGYREYGERDLARTRLVAGIRALDLSLDEIKELLAMQDRGEAPCRTLLELIKQKADEIEGRIVLLKHMQVELRQLYRLGLEFPTDDVDGKSCICHLVSQHAAAGARN